MSPLQIMTLLRLHYSTDPLADLPWQQRVAPAMVGTFKDFVLSGLLREGVDFDSVYDGSATYPFLTPKGEELVKRLCEVEP